MTSSFFYRLSWRGQLLFLPIYCCLILASCKNNPATVETAAPPTDTTAMAAKDAVEPASPPDNFKHQTAAVNGIKMHYVIGGTGDPLFLIHGFGQNWYMWNR